MNEFNERNNLEHRRKDGNNKHINNKQQTQKTFWEQRHDGQCITNEELTKAIKRINEDTSPGTNQKMWQIFKTNYEHIVRTTTYAIQSHLPHSYNSKNM